MSEPQDTGDALTGPGYSAEPEPVPVSAVPASIPIAELRQNAAALESWFNSVSDQQREAVGFMGGGYGIERASRDALDCAFRLASSAIAAMKATAEAIEALAQAMSAGTAETRRAAQGRSPASAVPNGDAPQSHPEDHSHGS